MVTAFVTTTSSEYVPGQTWTVPPGETAPSAAAIVEKLLEEQPTETVLGVGAASAVPADRTAATPIETVLNITMRNRFLTLLLLFIFMIGVHLYDRGRNPST